MKFPKHLVERIAKELSADDGYQVARDGADLATAGDLDAIQLDILTDLVLAEIKRRKAK